MIPLVSLQKRRNICRTLHELAGRQREALAAEDYDALISILGERKGLLEDLAATGGTVRTWAADREGLPDRQRAEGDALWEETRLLLASLAESEREAIGELASRRDATQAELRDLASAGRVNSAYRDSLAPVTHRSLDVGR